MKYVVICFKKNADDKIEMKNPHIVDSLAEGRDYVLEQVDYVQRNYPTEGELESDVTDDTEVYLMEKGMRGYWQWNIKREI